MHYRHDLMTHLLNIHAYKSFQNLCSYSTDAFRPESLSMLTVSHCMYGIEGDSAKTVAKAYLGKI